MKTITKNDHGFTLLEILAAVAILGISLVTIIGLQVKTIRLQQVSNRTTIATLLAQEMITEKLTELETYTSPPFYFEEGEFEDEEYESYGWEYTISTLPFADDLYMLDLIVYWNPEEKETQSVTLTTFIAMG
jgi:prepilin-type N-terminal cleavage/methylation domain-containing protein